MINSPAQKQLLHQNRRHRQQNIFDQQSLNTWIQNPFTLSLQGIGRLITHDTHGRQRSNLDLNPTLFNALAEQSVNQTHSAQWHLHFNTQIERMGMDQYIGDILTNEMIPLKPQSNHDILNALMWLSLPKTRWICTRSMKQAAQLRSVDHPKQRCKIEDRFTLFDESGVAIVSDQLDLLKLVEARAWKSLFCKERSRCRTHLKIWIVGHGLYEQLINPFIGLVGYGRLYHVPSELMAAEITEQTRALDDLISEDLLTQSIAQELPLSAIPILGYPGWWPSQESHFYDQVKYFRGPYPRQSSLPRLNDETNM